MKFNVQGLVVSREYKEASEQFTDRQGNVVKAQPDRYILGIVFGDKDGEIFNGVTSLKKVKVSEAVYNKMVKPFPCNVSIDMANSLEDYRTKIVKVAEFEILE